MDFKKMSDQLQKVENQAILADKKASLNLKEKLQAGLKQGVQKLVKKQMELQQFGNARPSFERNDDLFTKNQVNYL